MGRFYEFYHFSDRDTAKQPGLVRMKHNRRGARFGLPVRLAMQKAEVILNWGRSVLFIKEQVLVSMRMMQRKPMHKLVYTRNHSRVYSCDC